MIQVFQKRIIKFNGHILRLYIELHFYIFTFIPELDRAIVRLVCKRWHGLLILDSKILYAEQLIFDNIHNRQLFEYFKTSIISSNIWIKFASMTNDLSLFKNYRLNNNIILDCAKYMAQYDSYTIIEQLFNTSINFDYPNKNQNIIVSKIFKYLTYNNSINSMTKLYNKYKYELNNYIYINWFIIFKKAIKNYNCDDTLKFLIDNIFAIDTYDLYDPIEEYIGRFGSGDLIDYICDKIDNPYEMEITEFKILCGTMLIGDFKLFEQCYGVTIHDDTNISNLEFLIYAGRSGNREIINFIVNELNRRYIMVENIDIFTGAVMEGHRDIAHEYFSESYDLNYTVNYVFDCAKKKGLQLLIEFGYDIDKLKQLIYRNRILSSIDGTKFNKCLEFANSKIE